MSSNLVVDEYYKYVWVLLPEYSRSMYMSSIVEVMNFRGCPRRVPNQVTICRMAQPEHLSATIATRLDPVATLRQPNRPSLNDKYAGSLVNTERRPNVLEKAERVAL